MATRLECDLLIPGSGSPLTNGCVVIEGAKIAYAGPREGAPASASSDKTEVVPVVTPGFWDAHTHFGGMRTFSLEEQIYTSPWVGMARSVVDAQKVLGMGFTSVRELGGLGLYLGRATRDGSVPGPHIYGAGMLLSMTGGHGDAHAFPLSYVRGEMDRLGYPGPCDGVADCTAAVRKLLRLGAPVIKICATGGVLSDMDNPKHQEFSVEEMRAIVEEAGRAERIVAAHCHGKAGIMAALEAGVKTIEHGSYLDDESADRMLETGAILVPTRTIVHTMVSSKNSGIPEFMLEKGRALADRHRTAVRTAVRKKVPIALGTDIGGSSEAAPCYWGMNGLEFSLLVEDGGMTPLEAIEAGTANGALTLGPQAPRSGQLKEGYAADVLVLREDPLKNIASLTKPENFLQVWKDGKLAARRS